MGARSQISARWYGPTRRTSRYVSPPSEPINWTPVVAGPNDHMIETLRQRIELDILREEWPWRRS